MKKIILAVASVLALGMLVSCKQEVSGNLTVTNLNKSLDVTSSETYYYTFTGNVTQTSSTKNVTKATAAGAETSAGSSVAVLTSNKYTTWCTDTTTTNVNKVTLTVSTDPNNNTVTYTYEFPTVFGQTVTTNYNAAGVKTSVSVFDNILMNNDGWNATAISATQGANQYFRIKVYKINNKYYTVATDGSYMVLDGFNPTADSIDFSKYTDNTKKVTETLTSPVYNSDTGALDTYSKSTTTTTQAVSFVLTKC